MFSKDKTRSELICLWHTYSVENVIKTKVILLSRINHLLPIKKLYTLARNSDI